MLNSLTDENRNIRKQIGCMNGIFQLFHRHHFLTGRRISSHNHKKLLLGAQHQLEPHNATKAVITEREKPRLSTESSQASYSSSSYSSSTFSPVDHNKKAQTQTPSRRQTCIPESQFEEQQPLPINGPKSSHIRDVVKGSMHRQARGVAIKSFSSDERKATVMKHIDSPRPLQHSKFGKKSNDDERPVSLARFSYDGRESRDGLKTSMKLKELPRLSLDSRASSMKSSSALDSRSSFFGRDPHKENEKSSQAGPVNHETGGHRRSSSIVAKLMGLEDFPADTISTEFLQSTKKQASLAQPASQKNLGPSSPRLRDANSVRKSTVETAPWKQQECGPKTSGQSRKALTNISRTSSSSVYGEIEKRITELEFKRSGKDLRALKQILEAMQKTRERLDKWGGEPAKVMENANISTCSQMGKQKVQFLQNQDHKYKSKNLAQREKAQDFLPRNNMKEPSRRISSVNKKNTWRNLEPERTPRAPQLMKVENCSTSGRVFSMVSPRSKQNVHRIDGGSHLNNPSLESNGVKKHSCKKVREKFPQNRKHKVNSMDLQLSDDQMSELSSGTRHSSYHGDTASIKSEVVSDIEVEVLSLANSIKTNSRQQENSVSPIKGQMWGVEPAVTMVEQPSPVSVLDSAFYSEDSPSPVKKISTAFREEESPNPDEAEWHLQGLNSFSYFTKYEPDNKNDQKLERLRLINEPVLLKTEGSETTSDHNGAVYWSLSPDHRYINKILKASGFFKETSIMPTTNQLLSSSPLISPDIFHALEETEDPYEEANGELIEKNDVIKPNQKVERKIVFDAVNGMLVRKITSDRLFSLGSKRMSTGGLIKEVYLEMDYLCRMPYSNLDDEDDASIRLLAADMKYQSDEWTDQSGDVPALVLDIERLIFKDLINEVVTGEVVGLPEWPKRHCRQLF